MARELKYPHKHYVRLSDESQKLLEDRARVMDLAPAVVLRIIVEHSLSGKPIKQGGSNVRNTKKEAK